MKGNSKPSRDPLAEKKREIKSACKRIMDAAGWANYRSAAMETLTIWPVIREYVGSRFADNKKPDFFTLNLDFRFKPDFTDLFPAMSMAIVETATAEEIIRFHQEVLDTFSWERALPDRYYHEAGITLASLEREKECAEWYDKWFRERPNDYGAIGSYACALQEQGRTREALACLKAHMPSQTDVSKSRYKWFCKSVDTLQQCMDEENNPAESVPEGK